LFRENTGVNFAGEVLEGAPSGRLALLELARDGSRRQWSFGLLAERTARLAGTLAGRGIARGDVVMTLIGNRPEWVIAMMACFRLGAVVLPCTEQLRAKDLRLRLATAAPALILADERNSSELEAAAPLAPVLYVPDESLFQAEPAPAAALGADEPCLITFTSGTAGEPKAVVHAQRYLLG
jgi:acetyl-CoA synthetase